MDPDSHRDGDRYTVVLGPNGVGKSRLLSEIVKDFSRPSPESDIVSARAKPHSILAVSNLVSDVFPFGSLYQGASYRYLGLRQASNNMSTGSLTDSITNSLLEFESRRDSLATIEPVLSELQFDDWTVNVRTTSRSKRDISLADVVKDLDQHEILRAPTVARAISSRLSTLRAEFGSKWTDGHRLLVETIRELSFEFDIEPRIFIRMIRRFSALQIEVHFRQGEGYIAASSLSAGQAMLISMIGRIAASIESNSLVLIDEPETGLHPNWQSAFIPLLKETFRNGSGSHFFIATHSPFLVADASDVLIPGVRSGTFEEYGDPFEGRSVENILYRVFHARVTGNRMVEADLAIVISALSSSSADIFVSGSKESEARARLTRVASSDTPVLRRILSEVAERFGVGE